MVQCPIRREPYLCQRAVGGHLSNTYPQGAAAAPAGVGGATAFPGHLLPHLCGHRSAGKGRRPLGAGKLGQQGPENLGFGAKKFIYGRKIQAVERKKQAAGQEKLGFGIHRPQPAGPRAMVDT